MITVACVKWGKKYSYQHVNKLQEMVSQYLTVPHDFVCLTDNPHKVICKTLELTPGEFKGWWAKMNLFNQDSFNDWILYLDLDVIIHRNIDELVQNTDKNFYSIRDFLFPEVFNSSVMFWKKDVYSSLWKVYSEDPNRYMDVYKGDQDFVSDMVMSGDDWTTYPDEWTWSYKWGDEREYVDYYKKIERFRITDQAKIAVFHGRPNPWEIDMNEFRNKVCCY